MTAPRAVLRVQQPTFGSGSCRVIVEAVQDDRRVDVAFGWFHPSLLVDRAAPRAFDRVVDAVLARVDRTTEDL